MRLPAETLQRRKLLAQSGGDNLVDVLGFPQVAQLMLAEIAQVDVRRQEIADQQPCRFGEQDLPPRAGGEQAGQPVQSRREIIAVVRRAGAGVQGHADLQGAQQAPVFVGQGALRLDRGEDAIERRGECGLDGVANGFEPKAMVRPYCLIEECEMPLGGGEHRRSVVFPTPGAALDVGQEEGDGAAWQLAHEVRAHVAGDASSLAQQGVMAAMLTRGPGMSDPGSEVMCCHQERVGA